MVGTVRQTLILSFIVIAPVAFVTGVTKVAIEDPGPAPRGSRVTDFAWLRSGAPWPFWRLWLSPLWSLAGTGAWATEASASTGSGATSQSESSLQQRRSCWPGRSTPTALFSSPALGTTRRRPDPIPAADQPTAGPADRDRPDSHQGGHGPNPAPEGGPGGLRGPGGAIADDIPPGQTGTDPSLAVSYSEIVAANERRVLVSSRRRWMPRIANPPS